MNIENTLRRILHLNVDFNKYFAVNHLLKIQYLFSAGCVSAMNYITESKYQIVHLFQRQFLQIDTSRNASYPTKVGFGSSIYVTGIDSLSQFILVLTILDF